MNPTILLQKLIAIERSVGVATPSALRNSLQEAQDYLLQMQRESVELSWKAAGLNPAQRFSFLRRAS
jgi:hypothetical protein